MSNPPNPAERTAHTPGPWLAEANDSSVFDSEGREVADCLTFPFSGEVAEANARLIAAAPELYEVLREAERQIEYLPNRFEPPANVNQVLTRIRAALAKAEGRQP